MSPLGQGPAWALGRDEFLEISIQPVPTIHHIQFLAVHTRLSEDVRALRGNGRKTRPCMTGNTRI
jgi:hypothetical protein